MCSLTRGPSSLGPEGKSLLASGILDATGHFEAGDPVTCVAPDGKECAKGLVNFSSEVLARIKGLKTVEFKSFPDSTNMRK